MNQELAAPWGYKTDGTPKAKPGRRPLEEEIQRALEEIAQIEEDAGEVSVSQLKTNILNELNRRLGDPKAIRDVPGTGLLQLAMTLLKDKTEEPETLGVDPSVARIVMAVNLPPERKRELLLAEQAHLEEQTRACAAALQELEV